MEEKKSNWDKEIFWALKDHTTNLLHGRIEVVWELSRSVDSLTRVLYTAWINWKTSKWCRV